MRGPLPDLAHGASHASAYSALHDLNGPTSSSMCGGCHDVQNGHGVDIERTFAEWQSSLYAQNIPSVSETCSACHMLGSTGVAATTSGAPPRRVHDHSLAAFDVALGPFPESDAQRTLVQQTLDASIIAKLCMNQPSGPPNVAVTIPKEDRVGRATRTTHQATLRSTRPKRATDRSARCRLRKRGRRLAARGARRRGHDRFAEQRDITQ